MGWGVHHLEPGFRPAKLETVIAELAGFVYQLRLSADSGPMRSKPARRDVARAEKLYRQVNKRGFRERRYQLHAQDGVDLHELVVRFKRH